MTDFVQAVDFEKQPLAHAFLVALAVQGRLDELLDKARETTLDDAEKQELQGLLAARGPATRRTPTGQ